jgi:SSS family solute:Na+ symporter
MPMTHELSACLSLGVVLHPVQSIIRLSPLDFLMIGLYFALVIFIGFYLRRSARTSKDFFLAGRQMTAWIAGISFISANLGSLELMGWAGSAYQYGLLAAHAYWIGAIPAMLFLAIFMMPFYYVSRTQSVPGYLQLRFGRPTSGLSAVTFALMTILMSGINMYAMAIVMKIVLGWDLNFGIWVASVTVAVYVTLGGLRSAIYNEVLQFFLIWMGILVVPIMGLIEAGGWRKLHDQIAVNLGHSEYVHLWSTLGHSRTNPMGVHWTGVVFGWGLVLSFSYWTTDLLVIQRTLAAKDLRTAQFVPIIGAAFKMIVPLIVILPGILAISLLPFHFVGEAAAVQTGQHSYNEVLPLMMVRYCGPGLLGLGVIALIAGFMSGMAGNASAFATVWTYDIYGAFINRRASDKHYVNMGRISTLLGVFISIGTAYLVQHAASIMDYAVQLMSFFIAPLFATVLLGMMWKRATNAGGFWGLLAGICTSVGLWAWVKHVPSALRYVALSSDAKDMAENMYRALWSWIVAMTVTIVVSYCTTARPVAELDGLVYGATKLPAETGARWYQRPVPWAIALGLVFIAINIAFW